MAPVPMLGIAPYGAVSSQLNPVRNRPKPCLLAQLFLDYEGFVDVILIQGHGQKEEPNAVGNLRKLKPLNLAVI